MGDPRPRNMATNTELTAALASRAYGYGYPGMGPAGALTPHRHAYFGMQEHIKAEERMLDQRRTLYSDLRSAEAKEASAVEKRLSDEQTTATRLAEEHDQARRAAEAEAIAARAAEEHRVRSAEAKVTAEAAAQAAAALKRTEDALTRAQAAREAECKAAAQKAAEAREAEALLATSVAAEGQSMHERAGTEASCAHFAHHAPAYGYGGYGAPMAGAGFGYG